jgi:hypothetical protein
MYTPFVGAAAGCDLLILIFGTPGTDKRTQASPAPTPTVYTREIAATRDSVGGPPRLRRCAVAQRTPVGARLAGDGVLEIDHRQQCRIDLTAAFTWAKTETVEQAEQIRVAMALVDAVVHGVSLAGRVCRRFHRFT